MFSSHRDFPQIRDFHEAKRLFFRTPAIRGRAYPVVPLKTNRRSPDQYQLVQITDNAYGVKHYHTNVIIYTPDRLIISEYNSMTTNSLQNEVLPSPYNIFVHNKIKYLSINGINYPFGHRPIEINLSLNEPDPTTMGYLLGKSRTYLHPEANRVVRMAKKLRDTMETVAGKRLDVGNYERYDTPMQAYNAMERIVATYNIRTEPDIGIDFLNDVYYRYDNSPSYKWSMLKSEFKDVTNYHGTIPKSELMMLSYADYKVIQGDIDELKSRR